MIAIIDYGMGNLRSVQKALEKEGANTIITHDSQIIRDAEQIVLPGVGAIKPAIERLDQLGLVPVIQESISAKKPFLGICLGFQLLFEESHEGGVVQGLGILKGTVERFQDLKVPHMGWNQLKIIQTNSPLMHRIDQNVKVYFCHSYFVKPVHPDIILTTTDYGVEFTSAIAKDNVFGVQFHPEKSQSVGLTILKNFVEL